jgi:EF-P beta-lysylation protein EpmB
MQNMKTLEQRPSREASWRKLLAEAVRDPDELCDLLELPASFRSAARRSARLFPLLVPRSFLARMQVGNCDDPLLRQVLPLADETVHLDGFVSDPVGDLAVVKAPGLLQKYAGRALLILTGACAIHCRYCFRREFPYEDAPNGLEAWEPAFVVLDNDSSIHEIILSGGDPLTRTDAWLARLVKRLEQSPHLRRLRIHTRLPIVLPERVTPELIDLLTMTRLRSIVVVHANHPNELDATCSRALRRLIDAGIPVLNQAVLLKGVNDSADVLAELCERLADLGVIPYYIHQLDRVRGAHHFEVPESFGLELMTELHRRLPGFAVPRYVREVPGAPGKTPIR